jgi:hypothetical protein
MKRRKLTREKADRIQRQWDMLRGNDPHDIELPRRSVPGSTCRDCEGTGRHVYAPYPIGAACAFCHGSGVMQ